MNNEVGGIVSLDSHRKNLNFNANGGQTVGKEMNVKKNLLIRIQTVVNFQIAL